MSCKLESAAHAGQAAIFTATVSRSRKRVKEETDGGDLAVPGVDKIRSGDSRRLAGAALRRIDSNRAETPPGKVRRNASKRMALLRAKAQTIWLAHSRAKNLSKESTAHPSIWLSRALYDLHRRTIERGAADSDGARAERPGAGLDQCRPR